MVLHKITDVMTPAKEVDHTGTVCTADSAGKILDLPSTIQPISTPSHVTPIIANTKMAFSHPRVVRQTLRTPLSKPMAPTLAAVQPLPVNYPLA